MICGKMIDRHSCFAPGLGIGPVFSWIFSHEIVFPDFKKLRVIADFKGNAADIFVYFFPGPVLCNGQCTDDGILFFLFCLIGFLKINIISTSFRIAREPCLPLFLLPNFYAGAPAMLPARVHSNSPPSRIKCRPVHGSHATGRE